MVFRAAQEFFRTLFSGSQAETQAPHDREAQDVERRPAPERRWLSKAESDSELVIVNGRPTFELIRRDELRFVSKSSGLQAAPGNLALARAGVFYLRARGTRHYSAALQSAEIEIGSIIMLKREPNNEHDPKAIALCGPVGTAAWGYVNRGFARRLSPRLDRGESYTAVVTGVDGNVITVAIGESVLMEQLLPES